MDMVSDIIFACNYVRGRGDWVVVVVPDGQFDHAQRMLAAVADGHTYSGRTVQFATGGRVSLGMVSGDIFVPKGQPFSVMFLGWGKKTVAPQEMRKWRMEAEQMIRSTA